MKATLRKFNEIVGGRAWLSLVLSPLQHAVQEQMRQDYTTMAPRPGSVFAALSPVEQDRLQQQLEQQVLAAIAEAERKLSTH
jgi:hypothetical protein